MPNDAPDSKSTDPWRLGYDAGRAAVGLVVQMKAPAGVDAGRWITGFMCGRRARQDDEIMADLAEAFSGKQS
jgi:hypothetical protein